MLWSAVSSNTLVATGLPAEFAIDLTLLLLAVAVAVATIKSRDLFTASMLSGSYSLLLALVWVNMAAMDVAFTEAAVGAGISTILLLGTLSRVGDREKEKPGRALHFPALIVTILTGSVLVFGTLDMPPYGDPDGTNPVNVQLSPEYNAQTVEKIDPLEGVKAEKSGENQFAHHVPNRVTAVLAAYRSYDTMFESAVIFTAGCAMAVLLRRREDREANSGSSSASSESGAAT